MLVFNDEYYADCAKWSDHGFTVAAMASRWDLPIGLVRAWLQDNDGLRNAFMWGELACPAESICGLRVGDYVAYSVQFLKLFKIYSGDLPAMRGHVIRFQIVGVRQFARVQWTDPELNQLIIPENLAKVGPNIRFCAC